MPEDLSSAVERLAEFLGGSSLTPKTGAVEKGLEGQLGADVDSVARKAGFDAEVLDAALRVRSEFGRINDVIHAVAITLSLPHILDSGERITNRPSLASGNDPSRPFDIETDRRIAEFKLAQWTGSDAMRKRQVFKDLFKLTVDESGREAELYVIGDRPLRFLRESRSSAGWALNRHSAFAREFVDRFGTLEMSVRDFSADKASHVRIVDLREALPVLFESFE